MKSLRRFSEEKGFTLSELLTTMALLMIVGAVLANLLGFGLRALKDVNERSEAQREARYVVEKLVWELRAAEQPNDDVPAIEIARGNEIRFYVVFDEEKGPRRIHYFLQGNELRGGTLEATGSEPQWQYVGEEQVVPVAKFIRNNEAEPIFRFFDEDEVEFVPQSEADLRRIKFVGITIISDVDPDDSPSPYKHEARVNLRNQR